MQPDASVPSPPPVAPRKRSTGKFILITLVLLIAAFLGGFIPATMRARELEASLRTTQLDLRLANLHRLLGVAAEEAQRNNYANAAIAAREFFNGCTALVQSEAFATQPRTRNAIAAYASYRNEITNQLAAADPQVKERLAGLFLTMDGVLARRE